jgi:hypothetical protein
MTDEELRIYALTKGYVLKKAKPGCWFLDRQETLGVRTAKPTAEAAMTTAEVEKYLSKHKLA